MKVIKVLLIFLIIKQAKSCVTEPGTTNFFCTSWDKLKDGDFKEYKKLQAYMVGTSYQVLNEKFFDSKLGHLQAIAIKGGNFTIENNVFKGLTHLRTIDISDVDSKFVVTDGIFDNTSIQDISLFNCITDILPNSFQNMPNGRQIWIGLNTIKTIKKDIFTGTPFKMVFLGHNQIEHIEDGAFSDMKNLGYLDLRNNLLKTIDVKNIMGITLSFEVLSLSGNKLEIIKGDMLSNLPNIEIFNASGNNIKIIEDRSFAYENLWMVDISQNEITDIPDGAIADKNNLLSFYINDNRLQYLSSKLLEKLTKLKEISLSGNNWQKPCYEKMESFMVKSKVKNICEIIPENLISTNSECVIDELIEIEESKKEKSDCYIRDWRVISKEFEEINSEKYG